MSSSSKSSSAKGEAPVSTRLTFASRSLNQRCIFWSCRTNLFRSAASRSRSWRSRVDPRDSFSADRDRQLRRFPSSWRCRCFSQSRCFCTSSLASARALRSSPRRLAASARGEAAGSSLCLGVAGACVRRRASSVSTCRARFTASSRSPSAASARRRSDSTSTASPVPPSTDARNEARSRSADTRFAASPSARCETVPSFSTCQAFSFSASVARSSASLSLRAASRTSALSLRTSVSEAAQRVSASSCVFRPSVSCRLSFETSPPSRAARSSAACARSRAACSAGVLSDRSSSCRRRSSIVARPFRASSRASSAARDARSARSSKDRSRSSDRALASSRPLRSSRRSRSSNSRRASASLARLSATSPELPRSRWSAASRSAFSIRAQQRWSSARTSATSACAWLLLAVSLSCRARSAASRAVRAVLSSACSVFARVVCASRAVALAPHSSWALAASRAAASSFCEASFMAVSAASRRRVCSAAWAAISAASVLTVATSRSREAARSTDARICRSTSSSSPPGAS